MTSLVFLSIGLIGCGRALMGRGIGFGEWESVGIFSNILRFEAR